MTRAAAEIMNYITVSDLFIAFIGCLTFLMGVGFGWVVFAKHGKERP